MYDYRPVDCSPEGVARCAALLQACFPAATFVTEDYVRWQYTENPHGNVAGYNAFFEDQLVAHYVLIPMEARIDGEVERGFFSLNSATHADHRGKGLFDRLSHDTHALATEMGFSFIWGTSNDYSTRGALKLGFKFAGRMRAMIGAGPIARRKHVPEVRYEAVHSKEALAWRLRRPNARYGMRPAPEGTAIYAPTGKPGMTALLGLVEGGVDLPRASRGPISVWLGVDERLDWSRSLYFNLPVKLRPAPLNLMFKDLTGRGRVLDIEHTRVQVLDFDAF